MSKSVSQIIITEDEPRRNPGTDLWYNPSTNKLFYWSKSTESWKSALSGGSSTTTTTDGGGESAPLNTTDIIEGTNLFYTNQRVTDLADLFYLRLTQASAEYLNKNDASATYLSIVNGLSKAQASATYTPLTTFNTQLVNAFAALESLSQSLSGFDGDLATALEAIYLRQDSASATYATKIELQNSLLELDAAAVAYGLAL